MVLLKLLLIMHFLGDFYFQTNKISELKKENKMYLFFHVLIYTALFTPLLFKSINILVTLLVILGIFATHIICDYFVIKISKGEKTIRFF
ncbi:MAG: DUF3307 domain-containing protein [Acholeplasmataceae bacterium]|jgi:tryptophan-rich sensory protein|nr:DUF3307 domain-containing protein [Acholeplasmataceae bacterium]